MRISDWSSDVCSSDLLVGDLEERRADGADRLAQGNRGDEAELRGFGQAALGPRDEGGEEVAFLARPLPALAPVAGSLAARPHQGAVLGPGRGEALDRKSTRLNSSH